MKKLLCPLCGEMPEYIEFGCGDGESDLIQCNCGLCTSAGSYPNGEENCWKDWEKLVSKFPPIMRVWPGDKVKLFGERRARRIIGKNAGRGVLYLETVSGPPDPVRQDDVILWPWELNRKEASND